jgi:hypothetical protein
LIVVGDSSFEINAVTGKNAKKVIGHDNQVWALFNEMKAVELEAKTAFDDQTYSSHEQLNHLNKLADLSIRLENIFKVKQTSYLTQSFIKKESVKYRPSKTEMQTGLKI